MTPHIGDTWSQRLPSSVTWGVAIATYFLKLTVHYLLYRESISDYDHHHKLEAEIGKALLVV
jgi:hypothetical protein